ncbi:hypothetical protein ACLOJK_028421 [Asimina triloba]
MADISSAKIGNKLISIFPKSQRQQLLTPMTNPSAMAEQLNSNNVRPHHHGQQLNGKQRPINTPLHHRLRRPDNSTWWTAMMAATRLQFSIKQSDAEKAAIAFT